MTRIILLDIDGVLVQPGGYRAALRATVKRFVGDFTVEEDLLISLEKRGISSEWDMSPLIVAAYWDDVLAHQPMENLSENVAVAAKQIQSQQTDMPKRLSIPAFELMVGQYPAEAAFRTGCFQHIPEVLRRNLLTESRNFRKSETMRTFQHFTLGSKNYELTYQLPAEFEAESLLLATDRPNVSDEIVGRLRRPDHYLAGFTARPSGSPAGAGGSSVGYAPEAELALDLVGLSDIPLMAFGKLEYIAAQHALDPAALVKPSPFHALAGTLAAWTGEELSALRAVHDWHSSGVLNGRFSELPKSFELVVVEDTMGGIHSVRAAGGILRAAGFDVTVRVFGLTSGIEAKALAFESAGVPHFENWQSLSAGIWM
jgi:phosphoglycolate phosphatase-like HAD superfamily hydrolase